MNPTEWRQMLQLAIGLGCLGGFAWLYALGGRQGIGKRIRRWIGGMLFAFGCVALAVRAGAMNKIMFLSFLAYPAALTMGYGNPIFLSKLRRRFLYGLANGAVSGFFLLPIGRWDVWLFQIGLAISASLFWGLRNPTSAVGEEGAIGLLMVVCVPLTLIR